MSANLQAACRVRVIPNNETLIYDQNSSYRFEPTIKITNAHQCGTLNFQITPLEDNQFTFKGGSFLLNAIANFNQNNVTNSQGTMINQSISPVEGTVTIPFFVTLTDSSVPVSRIYNGLFSLRVFNTSGGELDNKRGRYRINVPPIFGIDILGSESAIDFGNLERGKSSQLQVNVTGNTGYTVSLKSQEGGVLKNTYNTATIRYKLSFRNQTVPISKTWSVVGQFARGEQTGLISATIDEETSGKTDGDYRDIIEILVQTQ